MAESRSRKRLSSQADEGQRQGVDLTNNLPATVVLSLLEWLAIPDLLAIGTVDCSFRDLTKEELPWKAAARHLWKSALLDGQQLLSVDAAGIHETARDGEVSHGRASGLCRRCGVLVPVCVLVSRVHRIRVHVCEQCGNRLREQHQNIAVLRSAIAHVLGDPPSDPDSVTAARCSW